MIKKLLIPTGDVDAITTAQLHWKYIKSILELHGENSDVIRKCGEHYVKAFLHGWKHGIDHSYKNATKFKK